MGSFSHRVAAKMCLSTSLQSNEPGIAPVDVELGRRRCPP
jgi:hypothetical protein